jgi:hypothetical protein
MRTQGTRPRSWIDEVADEIIAKTERMIRFAQRMQAEHDTGIERPPPGLSPGVRDALVLARDLLMTRCACPAMVTGRGLALDAINRELKLAGYVWRQGHNGPELVMPRPAERRRAGRSTIDPHAGCNPTITERRGKVRD